MNQTLNKILEDIKAIHDKKSADYATDANPYSNFERAATIASWFTDDIDKVFATMIGIKLARIAELSSGKEPKNESLNDSRLDLCTYNVLWYSYRLDKK